MKEGVGLEVKQGLLQSHCFSVINSFFSRCFYLCFYLCFKSDLNPSSLFSLRSAVRFVLRKLRLSSFVFVLFCLIGVVSAPVLADETAIVTSDQGSNENSENSINLSEADRVFAKNTTKGLPFLSPQNSLRNNLLLLTNMAHPVKDLLRYENIKHSDTETESADEDNKNVAIDIKTIRQDRLENQLYVNQFPAELIFDKATFIAVYQEYIDNMSQRLKAFGLPYSYSAANDLLSLNRFNQLVAQDSELDNSQKQLLIGLRASFFSYYHKDEEQQKESLTSDEIIGGRIANLPDTGRISEYKHYLLYLDKISNFIFNDETAMPELPTAITIPTLLESARFLQLQYQSRQCNAQKKILATTSVSDNGDYANQQFENCLMTYSSYVEEFNRDFPNSSYLIRLYRDASLVQPTSPSLFHAIWQNLADPKRDPNQQLIDLYETNSYLRFPHIDSGVLSSEQVSSEQVVAEYEFLLALTAIPENEWFKQEHDKAYSNQQNKVIRTKLADNIEQITSRLDGANRQDLADFVRINTLWFLKLDAKKTISAIESLQLQVEQASRPDQFAYWMMLVDAYQSQKKYQQATDILQTLKAQTTQQQEPELRFLPAQLAYIDIRLEELAELADAKQKLKKK